MLSWCQVKGTPVPLCVVEPYSGTLIWQNAASMDAIGVFGLDNMSSLPGQPLKALNYLGLLFQDEQVTYDQTLERTLFESHDLKTMGALVAFTPHPLN
jgi:hypothetical protein